MNTPKLLPAHCALDAHLSDPSNQLSILSYNILLPNNLDGWWIFKSYDPSIPMQHRQWPHRHALLKAQLLSSRADIICIQEASAASFEQDFAFLIEAGYDLCLHDKYTFRNATFWRRDRLSLVQARHKDRTLLTTLKQHATSTAPARHIYIANCHLSGGPAPERRFRQAFEALDQLRKDAARQQETPEQTAVILCGDLNSYPGDSGLTRLLNQTPITPDYREADYPDIPISSKHRSQPFGTFTDVYLSAYRQEDARPATFITPFLADRFIDLETGQLQPQFIEALHTMFKIFTKGQALMDRAALNAWISTVNLEPARGSEHQKAITLLNENNPQALTIDDFIKVYLSELEERKFRPITHDLAQVGITLQPTAPEAPKHYAVCLDRIYTSPALTPIAARAPLTPEQYQTLLQSHAGLPNSEHPSDHLPLAAIVQWR